MRWFPLFIFVYKISFPKVFNVEGGEKKGEKTNVSSSIQSKPDLQ
jgi:hypothetical protein